MSQSPDNLSVSMVVAMKAPIDKIPVGVRIKIYELPDDVINITNISPMYGVPWARTIVMSGMLNDKDAIEIAAIQGDGITKIMCELIAISGNLPMMKWARSKGASTKHDATSMDRLSLFPWDEATCSNAAMFGRFKLLKWLHEQGCPWNEMACEAAARRGNVGILQWLHSRGCPWNMRTCEAAAYSGNLEMLQWLRSQDCPWNEHTCRAAMNIENQEMWRWVIENNCPEPRSHDYVAKKARIMIKDV